MNDGGDSVDQIILVDKPVGVSSFGVVARVRRYLANRAGRKVKVGHCGTLDPFATGLLILVSGKFTKRAGEFSGLDKTYRATICLGAESTTGDPEGEITEASDTMPVLEQVEDVLSRFIGEIEQTPPVYSAIKINGQRAYKLARSGQTVDMPTRRVKIYDIKLVNYNYPYLTIEAKVSSGTYIRSLAIDIGKELGVGAYTVRLRRLSVGDYSVDNAHGLDDFTV